MSKAEDTSHSSCKHIRRKQHQQVITGLLLVACSCLLGCLTTASAAVSVTNSLADDERLFKAAFIYNFAKLTSWPENTWKNTDAPLILCTAGNDQLAGDLSQLAGKVIKGRSVSTNSLESGQDPAKCHVLYIAMSETENYKKILKSVTHHPVLSISEIPGFVQAGGLIELYRENQRTRFLIDLGKARQLNLQISSRLLRLATVVGNRELP